MRCLDKTIIYVEKNNRDNIDLSNIIRDRDDDSRLRSNEFIVCQWMMSNNGSMKLIVLHNGCNKRIICYRCNKIFYNISDVTSSIDNITHYSGLYGCITCIIILNQKRR